MRLCQFLHTAQSRIVKIILIFSLVFVPHQANAACAAVLGAYASASMEAISAIIIEAYVYIAGGFAGLKPSHMLFSNQESNNTQNQANALNVVSDRETAARTGNAISQLRSQVTRSLIPTRTSCRDATAARLYGDTSQHYEDTQTQGVRGFLDFGLNKDGGISEGGSVAAANNIFERRCGRYMDSSQATADCPAATDPTYANLDVNPMRAIYNVTSFDTPERQQAAIDSVQLLVDTNPGDPLQGSMLMRNSGRVALVERNKKLGRNAIAYSILMDAVSMRSRTAASSAADGKDLSRLERSMDMVYGGGKRDASGKFIPDPAARLIEDSGYQKNARLQNYLSSVSTQQMALMRILETTSRMIVAESAKLASIVDTDNANTPNLMNRGITQ